MNTERIFVPYYRVSTEKQGKSGLGIGSQKRFVRDYCLDNGKILSEFSDVFSGSSAERQGLSAAIKLCKETGATLVAYDITRISRGGLNVRWILEESGIEYLGALSPHDSSFSKGIKFEVAKEEKERISRNTKKALGEISKRIEEDGSYTTRDGNTITSLGKPENLTDLARERSAKVRRRKAQENPNNRTAYTLVKVLKEDGGKSLKQISAILNNGGYTTSRGGNFSPTQVSRLINLYK